MAASAKTLSNQMEDWTVVLPRRNKHRKNIPKLKSSEEQQQAKQWFPTDVENDPKRESDLIQKMLIYIKKLEDSQFYQTLLTQIETPNVLENFLKILGTESSMQMVIYGIGSIESYEPPRLQLSLAILIKRKFSWIGRVEVFDPIISLAESRVLEALGCSVLSVNEFGRRQAIRPTLFFMPHCEAELYDNLLHANWRVDMLNRMVLFGNSFSVYQHYGSIISNSTTTSSRQHILHVRRFAEEFEIATVSDDYFRAFNGSSWHFFSLDSESQLQLVKL
ncbi:Protein SENSITIVITY TO RED LIGHT REDUCED 1 [Heracleum sosnowskyi]|uniref:Protein SENSITIVITY TO RED LIGHT REDUCED 1 n=1 Tax=Heracleum sosnowskyi TaxID=360622 RepID=A0AAD8N3P5_9APIA|nr:Protein SENSITIVITY TO RED LIGHT REDUCED 1 [Heracleum sosnowskyi]